MQRIFLNRYKLFLKQKVALCSLSIALATTLAVTAHWKQGARAQISTQLQQSTQGQPGAIIEQLKDPFTGKPRLILPAEQNPTEVKPPVETPAIENEIPELKIDESLKRKILINDIRVEGITKLTPKEVEAVVNPYKGKESSFLELQEALTDKLTALYEKKGYITALTFIPPQKIEEGIITIKADEGQVSVVTLEGTRWYKPIAVLPRVSVDEGKPFNVVPLQRSLRRLNENPDLTLQATLRAGKNPGDTEVILTPRQENFFVHVTPFIDNLGRPVIGNERYGVTVSNNNFLGLGDTAFSSPYWTRKSFGIINGYELPIGPHGTKLGFANAHTTFELKREGFNLQGRSNINTPYISQELFRNEHFVVGTELGLAIKNSTFQVDDSVISRDKLRTLTSALNMQQFDRTGRTFMRHEFALGLNIVNATEKNDTLASRPRTGSKFFRYTASLSRLQKLPLGTYGILKIQGQLTPDRLFSLEQIQVGGASSVRGYQEGRLIGDQGFLTSLEWRAPLRFIPASVKVGNYQLNQNLELVSFFDAGGVFANGAFTGVNIQSGSVQTGGFLMGTGVGLRARLTRFLSARVDVGIPLIHQRPDRDSARVHFGVESRLF